MALPIPKPRKEDRPTIVRRELRLRLRRMGAAARKMPLLRRSPIRPSRKPIRRGKPLRSKRKSDPRMKEWHQKVIDKGYDPEEDLYRCFHTGEYFPREQMIGDHFPLQKGTHPEIKYDPAAGVCSSVMANDGGSPKRRASVRHWRKTGLVVPVWERSPDPAPG